MFIELHKYKEPGKFVLVDLQKAEMIQDHFISFEKYAVNVEETYEELKNILEKYQAISN